MRRKHLILASCIISALLLTFTFHVSADENVTADAGASSNSAPLLDSYFWENYDLLPYIESSGQQYINTSIAPSSDYIINVQFEFLSDYNPTDSSSRYIFGSIQDDNNRYGVNYGVSSGNFRLYLYSGQKVVNLGTSPYYIHNVLYDQNDVYVDSSLQLTNNNSVSFTYPLYLFTCNNIGNPSSGYSSVRLYKFSIYDTSLNDPSDLDSGEIGYIRYYYPARAKSSGIIGLYDAVNNTFVTTLGSVPFESPTDDQVIHFQIGDFIENGLGWIGDILEFAIEEPMILMFMAIGLCGVAFRWARRVVHF